MQTMQRYKNADEVEAVFYEAFRRCDAAVMASLWAERELICIHPGARAIVERNAIVRSWESILGNSGGIELKYHVARRWQSDDLAVHTVAEELVGPGSEASVVLATNVYRRSADGWLMVEHHASLVHQQETPGTLQ